MERYSHLQSLPNSPFSPLTPLSENTAFDFNFGGDGSLDVYIDNIRHTHRVEQQQKSSGQTKNEDPTARRRFSERFLKIRDVFEPQQPQQQQKEFEVPPCRVHLKDPPKKHCCHAPKESQLRHTQPPLVHHKDCQLLKQQQQQHHHQQPQPASRPTVKIIHTGASPHMPKEYMATPKTVRTPLKPKNCNVSLNLHPQPKMNQFQTPQQKQQYRAFLQSHRRASTSNLTQQQQQHQPFRQASPVAVKPLSPRISKILHHRGLAQYCGLFQRQEIDLFSFKLLQLNDLQQMGVTDPKHCDMILTDICYARQYY